VKQVEAKTTGAREEARGERCNDERKRGEQRELVEAARRNW